MRHRNSSQVDKPFFQVRRAVWFFGAVVALVLTVWTGWDMVRLTEEHRLWGYRPLSLLMWSYFFISFLWNGFRKTEGQDLRHYLLATTSAILMGVSLPPVPLLICIIPAWSILIYLLDQMKARPVIYQFRVLFHLLFLWNIITTYWVSNTAFAAGIVAMVANTFLMCLPLLLFNRLARGLKGRYLFLLFAACWLTFEFTHFRWEAHWPWLTLGHYFMDMPVLVQWYEWTGVLGGSLWILALAWRLYHVIIKRGVQPIRKELIFIAVLFIIPTAISLVMGNRTIDSTDKIEVAVIQPNFEPHYVKGKIPQSDVLAQFMKLSNQVVTDETDYLVFPETSFSISLNHWENSPLHRALDNYLIEHPKLTLISGLESTRILEKNEAHDQFTRTHIRNTDTIFWENQNSAIRMAATAEDELYYKSKLVPGAEFFPFRKTLFFMKPLMDKLGGSGSGLRSQPERESFEGLDGHRVAPVICYESVFGEYMSGYVQEGAEWIAVMTNDGWWDNTAGHKQHLGLSRLRAIEQRKWVARSANSGISCFIDPFGQVYEKTSYGQEAAIRQEITTNSYRTTYSKVGDMIGRLALLMVIGALFYQCKLWIFRTKN